MDRRRSFPVSFRDATDPVFSLFQIFTTDDSYVREVYEKNEGSNDLNRSVSVFSPKPFKEVP